MIDQKAQAILIRLEEEVNGMLVSLRNELHKNLEEAKRQKIQNFANDIEYNVRKAIKGYDSRCTDINKMRLPEAAKSRLKQSAWNGLQDAIKGYKSLLEQFRRQVEKI